MTFFSHIPQLSIIIALEHMFLKLFFLLDFPR